MFFLCVDYVFYVLIMLIILCYGFFCYDFLGNILDCVKQYLIFKFQLSHKLLAKITNQPKNLVRFCWLVVPIN